MAPVRMVGAVRVLFVLSVVYVTKEEDLDGHVLQIGVFPEWFTPIKSALLTLGPLETATNLSILSVNQSESGFNEIKEDKIFLEKNNIDIVIGPLNECVAAATEDLAVPYICTSPAVHQYFSHVFQLHPPIKDFGRAISDLALEYNTERISLLYDNEEGLNFLKTLMTVFRFEIKTWRINDDTTPEEIRNQLVGMRASRILRRIVVCNPSHMATIFEEASHLAMLTAPNEWFIYDPGYELEDLLFRHTPGCVVNFTVFSITNPTQVLPVVENRLNNSLAMDAVMLLEKAISDTPMISNASRDDKRSHINSNLQMTDVYGYSGHIMFDSTGERIKYEINMNGCNGRDVYQIGTWNSTINMEQVDQYWNVSIPFPLSGKEVMVVMILEKPFTLVKEGRNLTGNDRFEGYSVDLLQEISAILNFTYNIYLVNDGKFGSKTASGEWNGMIGELLAGNATMSVAPLSINAAREQAVDFTKPFMNRYINVLLKVPPQEKTFFEFLYPLQYKVYLCIIGAFAVVGFCLFFIEKYSVNRSVKKSGVTMKQSLWFIFGSLLQNSTDVFPVTVGGRMLSSTWWFFVLILVSSYTANLAAFLTVRNIKAPVQSVSDLASQSEIKYGTVKSSAALSFFETTNIETFGRMASQMLDIDPSVLVDDSEEGFRRVMEGNYAFLWDSTVNKYIASTDCLLTQIGPDFAPRGFGIGVPPGATYLEELSMTILRLSDLGVLDRLEQKWWKKRDCEGLDSDFESNALRLNNVAGLFFILGGGILLALFIGFIETGIRNLTGRGDIVNCSPQRYTVNR